MYWRRKYPPQYKEGFTFGELQKFPERSCTYILEIQFKTRNNSAWCRHSTPINANRKVG